MFYATKTLKNNIKKRSKELDISMSDYIRTLVKKDIKERELINNNLNYFNNIYDIDNFNKKLLGFYKGVK